jgi:hypothetical protein
VNLKFKMTIVKDDFTLELDKYKRRCNDSHQKWYLYQAIPILVTNINESFKKQVSGSGTSEVSWPSLKDSTVKRRVKKGTWHGMGSSILKETDEFQQRLSDPRMFSIRKDSSGYHLTMVPSGTHLGYDRSPISMSDMIWYHTITNPRPPLSFLPSTVFKITNDFSMWFFK